MSKTFKGIITLFLSIIVLAACNTTEDSTSDENSATVTEQTEGKEVNESVDTEEPSAEDSQQEETDSTQEGKSAAEESTDSITFSSKGESKTEEVTSVSSEQYTIKVIPGFTLTPEEPGKEMLYFDEDDSISMRIEAMTTNDTAFEDLVAGTEETMTAVSSEYEQYDISTIIENANLENAAAYIANFGTEEVISVVFEKEDKLVRLTVYDNEEADLSEAMIKMGLTIE